jgi:hypothetical protein
MARTQNSAYNLDTDIRTDADNWFIQSPLNTDYVMWIELPYPITITRVMAFTTSGTYNITFYRKHGATITPVAGLVNQVVFKPTALEPNGLDVVPTANNSFVAGDRIWFAISNVTNAILSSVQINYTRDYTQA